MADESSSPTRGAIAPPEPDGETGTTPQTVSADIEEDSRGNPLASEEDVLETNDGHIGDEDPSTSGSDSASNKDTQTQLNPRLIDVVNLLERSLIAAANELTKITTKPRQTAVAEEGTKETFLGEISRLPMSDWSRKTFLVRPSPTVAFKAYYRRLPTFTTRTSEVPSTDLGHSQGFEPPRRIAITSFALISELEGITNISGNPLPFIMKPPYKVFIQFWPEIKQRLAKLRNELLNLEAQKNPDPVGGNETTEKPQNESNAEHDTDRNRASPSIRDEWWLRWRVSHLETLHNFIETELDHQLKLRTKVEDETLEAISFEDLWQLFSPGDLLYSRDHGFEQLYRAYAVTGGQLRLRNRTSSEAESLRRILDSRRFRSKSASSDETGDNQVRDGTEDDHNPHPRGDALGAGTWTAFTIDCFNIATDGSRFGAISCHKRVPRYIGEKKLTDLPIFPLKFLPNKDDVLQRLEKRGLRCVQCDGHKRYDGFAYDQKGRPSRERLQGDVYVDFKEYYRKRRINEPRLGILRKTIPESAEIEEELGPTVYRFSMDHGVDQRKSDVFLASNAEEQQSRTRDQVVENSGQLRLMGHQVVGFAFRSRKWIRLEIDFVDDIDKSAEARNGGFDDLIILPKYRRLLVSLVDSHASDAHKWGRSTMKDSRPLNQLDLVRGKGLGLVVLLHGPPGTGKTSTAETIATYTGRPLYSITCGDLGDTPNSIENGLRKHTSRADKWGCVLLLDEADVFLMRRDFKDMERNAIVSIFLRTLEYYSGILFLTTNRVGVIDEAFKSRVHIALRYPKVRLTTTLEIWKGCLDRIERDNEFRDVKIEFDRNELMEFAEEHYQKYHKKNSTWDGRQIRNAFQTAIALGQYERTSKIKRKGFTEDEALASGKKKWRVIQLTRKNLETIAETAQDFDKYMKSVHRFPDVEIAKADQLRDDDFSESSEEEEITFQRLGAPKRSSGRGEGAMRHASNPRKSGKSVATSSSRVTTRSRHQVVEQRSKNSSGDNLSAEAAAQSSSEPDTDD